MFPLFHPLSFGFTLLCLIKCSCLNIPKHSFSIPQLKQFKVKLNFTIRLSSAFCIHLYFFISLLPSDFTFHLSTSDSISVDAWLLPIILFVRAQFFLSVSKFHYLCSFFSSNNVLAISAIFGRFSPSHTPLLLHLPILLPFLNSLLHQTIYTINISHSFIM